MTDDSASLPPLHARWVREALGRPIPVEPYAMCDDCAMCAGDELPPTGGRVFDATVKCCTFLPELPNFLVGRSLADEDAASAGGRESVRARIRARVAVTPLGLGRPASYARRYADDPDQRFGFDRALRCPHLTDDGRCGVWRHREATCATWFCKHARGALGNGFWRDAMQPLLACVERDLARWCLLQLEVDADALPLLLPLHGRPAALDAADGDGVVDAARYRAYWGRWAGREEAFYQECAARVEPLRWADVLAATGPEVSLRAAALARAYDRHDRHEVPLALTLGQVALVGLDADTVRVRTYSPYDAIDLPRPLFDLLHRFGAAPTTEAALAEARARDGVELDPALVHHLIDFGILVPRS